MMTSPTIEERFPTAATSSPPTNGQRAAVADLQAATIVFAKIIDELVPEGRDKSIALTSLEDVLMRANRGVFTGHPAGGVDVSAKTVEVPAGGVVKGGVVMDTTSPGGPALAGFRRVVDSPISGIVLNVTSVPPDAAPAIADPAYLAARRGLEDRIGR